MPPSGGPKKRKAAGREGGGPKRAKGEPGSSSEGGGVPTTEGPRTPENLEAGETDDEMPPPASREPGARPGVSGQVGSMEPEAGRALVGRRVSVWDTADHRYRKGSVLGFDQEARMAFVRFEDGEREWTDLGKARMKLLGEDSPGGRGQSGSPPGGAATKTGSSGRRSPRRRRSDRRRVLGFRDRAGGQGGLTGRPGSRRGRERGCGAGARHRLQAPGAPHSHPLRRRERQVDRAAGHPVVRLPGGCAAATPARGSGGLACRRVLAGRPLLLRGRGPGLQR